MSERNNNNNLNDQEMKENNGQNNPEEYEEEIDNQLVEEEGQEFAVAFDIQINDASYILLIGKTEEKKLILRLVDKDDETKPFYQNEFSLDELKEINNYFEHFTNENDAIDSIIKNLNENDKEIEILDDNNIKLTVQINEEGEGEAGTNVDFILPKLSFEIEEEGDGEEQHIDNGMNINIQNEGEGEEEIENIEDDNENYRDNYMENAEHIEEANLEYSEENGDKNGQNVENLREQNINENIPEEEINKEQNNIRGYINDNNNKQNELQTIIEDAEENRKKTDETNEKNEIDDSKYKKEENIEKENEKNGGEETKISRVIEELKNNLDSLGGAMNYIEQDEEEQEKNTKNENCANKAKVEDFNIFKNEILKTINDLSNNFNKELEKQNDFFISQQKIIKEENENKINDLFNKLKNKDNELKEIKNTLNKNLNDKLIEFQNDTKKEINKINDEIKNIKIQDKKIDRINTDSYKRNNNNNELEKNINNINTKIKDIEQKINNMKNDINKCMKNNNDNINIKSLNEKVNNLENKQRKNEDGLSNNTKLINDKYYNIDKQIKSFEIKLNNLENLIKERKNLSEKYTSLENKLKTLEKKVNDYENNKNKNELLERLNNLENNNKEFLDHLENLENIINELETEKNESHMNFQKALDEINNNDIINKVNDLINIINKYETDIKNLNDNFKSLEKRTLSLKSEPKKQNINKKPKESNDLYIKENTSSDDQRIINISNTKNYKRQKQPQINNSSNNIIEKNQMISKNYRIIRQIDENLPPKEKKYISQTFKKGNHLISHSVNRLNIRPENSIDNNIEYQVYTRPRSRSKEHKRSKEQQQNLIQKEKEKENNIQPQKYKIKNYMYSNANINQNETGINESCIVQEEDIEFIENRLQQIYPDSNISYNLVYRASEDGDKSLDFHKRCDKIGPNLTFIKTSKGYIFGGFTAKNWEHLKRDININKPNLGSASRDPKAFGFSVNYQKIYNNERKNEFAIWCNRNYGPTFKNNFFQIFDNCLKKGGYCSIMNNSHFGGQKSDYEITGGEPRFAVYEIEVFELLFE